MPALTTTHANAQKRDGRAFDEVSDAVDEGQCAFSASSTSLITSLTLPPFAVNVQKLKLWDDESEFDAQKDKAHFRQYEDACDRVKNFYKEQHGMDASRSFGHHHLTLFDPASAENQTVAFNIQARVNFKSRRRARMGIWQAMEMLDTLVDESDPDVSLSFQFK